MEITKANMTTEGNAIKFAVPFQKVNVEKRTVSGFATMDNLDSHGDVLTSDASSKAFARFRGNVREMHAPIAVGKVLSFEERTYVDPDTNEIYNGIWVDVYVSTGAEETWQKVLDGTLTGFSIGGKIVDATEKFDKSSESVARWVSDYELTELSLVDNPANQLCNVFAIQKSADGTTTITGMAVDVQTENIFMCNTEDCGFAVVSKKDTVTCADCDSGMKNIGWVEANSTEKAAVIKSLVAKAKSTPEFASGGFVKYTGTTTSATPTYNITVNTTGINPEELSKAIADSVSQSAGEPIEKDGGVDVADNETVEETQEDAVVEQPVDNAEVAPTAEAPAEEEAETADNSEVADEVDLEKMLSNGFAEIKTAIETSKNESAAAVATVTKSLEETAAALTAQISDLETRLGALDGKITTTEKRVDSVEGETAMKKSADLGGAADEDLTKNNSFRWDNAFLSVNEL